jgi:tRNA threonylcarbamoyladenosine biosynthesis protein TsaB
VARGLPVLGISTMEAIAHEAGARRVVVCIDARMREVYYAALEAAPAGWREVISTRCIAPQEAPRPPGDDWLGCGNAFAVYGNLGLSNVQPEVHATAMAIAELAAPRLAAGEGVDAAAAAPIYIREKVAYTQAELARR